MKSAIFVSDKIFRHGDVLRDWMRGGNPFPITVEIDPSGQCNSRCPRCVGGEHAGMLSIDTVDRVLHELAANGSRGVIFTGGGEPTLHPCLAQMLEVAYSAGLSVGLITNGLALSDTIVTSVARYCTWCRVSLDAGTAEDYRTAHGGTPEEFAAVCDNIARLSGIDNRHATIGVGVLVDTPMIPSVVPSAVIAKNAGADYVQYRPYYYGMYGDTSDGIDMTAYRAAYLAASELSTLGFHVVESSGKFAKLEAGELGRTYSYCWGQQFCAVISSTGDVPLCCLLRGQQKFILGNVNDQSFADIWNGPRRMHILAELDVTKCPPLCRCDGMNDLLQAYINTPVSHEDFL